MRQFAARRPAREAEGVSRRSFLVHKGEWILTSMTSSRFKVTGFCRDCHRGAAGPVWHSISQKETLCLKCGERLGLQRGEP